MQQPWKENTTVYINEVRNYLNNLLNNVSKYVNLNQKAA